MSDNEERMKVHSKYRWPENVVRSIISKSVITRGVTHNIKYVRFGPHDWHLVEMPHFAWIWISLQSSFMVPLPIFAEFSNPNIHLYIVPIKDIGKAATILKLPSLSANCLKNCPKSSSEKIPHFKRRPLPILAASSATGHFFSTRLARETVQQPKPPLLPSFTCPGTVNPGIKQNITIILILGHLLLNLIQ